MPLPNNTYSAPGTSFYALANQSASNWYNFPSLTGEVKLIDTSGVQILKSIESNLFFNNELLAKASDLSNVADWSIYPALSTIQMDNQSIVGASTIEASTIQSSNITAILMSSMSEFTSSLRATTATIGTGLGGNVTIGSGNITANGSMSAVGVTTTAGLNMSNSAITNATTIGISANGFPPYGQLSSPDGSNLTWNGASIVTGGAGSASNWSFYPQLSNLTSFTATQMSTATLGVSTINGVQFPEPAGNVTQWAFNPALSTVQLAGKGIVNVSTLTDVSSINTVQYYPTQQWSGFFATGDVVLDGNKLQGGTNKDLDLISQDSNVNITSYYNTNIQASDVNITADTGVSITNTPQVKIIAQNGPLGGNVEIDALASAGGVAGFGSVTINAYGSSNKPLVPVGGLISLNAYSGGLGDYGGLTSAIRATAATVGISAGALPAIPATAGSLNLYGNDIVSITAGLPGVLPQIIGTVYCYAPVGVNLESPFGITANNSFYTGNIYPIANGSNPLVIQGRSLPTAGVQLKDIELMNMVQGLGQITAVSSINNMSLGGSSLSNVSSISVSTINGFAFPQTVVIPSTFLDFYASTILVNSIGALNNSTIFITAPGGQGLILAGDVTNGGFLDINNQSQISTQNFAALGNDLGPVFIGGNTNTDFSRLSMNDGGLSNAELLVQRGSFNIDASGICISTNQYSLSTATFFAGDVAGGFMSVNNLTATLAATSSLTLDAPTVDITVGDVVNIVNLTGAPATNLTLFSFADLDLVGTTNANVGAGSGTLLLEAQTAIDVNCAAGPINLNANTEVVVGTSVLNMDNNKITNLAPGTTTTDGVNFNQLTFRDATEFYVSAQGLDTNNGSILSPKLTIQAAITAAELISSAANICVINVASGHYVENLTFNKGYVILTGSLQSQVGNEVSKVTGSITINCTGANDVFNRQVSFQGFNLTMVGGQNITNTSSASHTVAFQDVKVFVDNVFYTSSASSPDMRTYFTNMEITSVSALNTATVITTNVGLVEFERVDMTVNGNAIGIAVAGTSVLNRCSLSTFDNTNTAVILKPLINITSSTVSAHSLGNVAFTFTSSVAKTNTNAIAIASSIATNIIMLNCVFTLAGTASSTNFCVGYNGVGSPTIAGVNNTSLSVNVLLPQTVTVQSGITQVSYIDINPPGLATYSSSVDQAIALTAVPQALTFNTTQFNQGTTLLLNSRVYANAQGNYVLNYSVELQHTGAGPTQLATTFLKKNGTTIANTGRVWSISSASFQNAAMAEFTVALNAGDYVEVFFSGDTSLSANATAAAGALPAIPSVVFNIKQFR